MPTKEEVYEALHECYDPEIPVNIVDLVWDPPWEPSMMSAEAKQKLGVG